jgi:hypothetical protein
MKWSSGLLMKYGYITFKSVSFAMKAESILKKKGISFKTIPVPRSISTDCGISIRFKIGDKEEIESLLEGVYEKIYLDPIPLNPKGHITSGHET